MSEKGRCASCRSFGPLSNGNGNGNGVCRHVMVPMNRLEGVYNLSLTVAPDFGCVHWSNPNYECQQRWRSLVACLSAAVAAERRYAPIDAFDTSDLTWRGQPFTTCPFCAATLKTAQQEPDILKRHP